MTSYLSPGSSDHGGAAGGLDQTDARGVRRYVAPIALGMAVLIAGLAPWLILAPLNARVWPELPWAAIATAVFLVAYVWWLNGGGPPRSWREVRRYSLRLWRPTPRARTTEGIRSVTGMLALLAVFYVLWVVVGQATEPPPDMSPYPTTAFRFSILIMGPVVSGVVEEIAFRGYLQSRLERYGPGTAIAVTSIVFVLFHGVHGLSTLVLLGPGFFAASMLYGYIAHNTGTIVPGTVMHVVGDLAVSYFGLLGGDASLLFAD